MNDATEGLLMPLQLSSEFDKLLDGQEFAHQTEHGEVREPTNPPFILKRKQLEKKTALYHRKKYFSVSFSKVPDSLPMWKNYGLDGKGLSLGFDSSQIVNQGYDILDCIYNNDTLKRVCKCLFDCNCKNTEQLPPAAELNIISKDPHYEYEKECRIPIRLVRNQCAITKRNQFHPLKYALKGGFIVPYIEVFLPLSALTEIWIGPTNHIDLDEDSLRGWLESIGLSSVKIKRSTAPLQ